MTSSPSSAKRLGVIISLEDNLGSVGAAASPEEAVELVTREAPDVALVDIDLPTPGNADFDGIKHIKAARPETRVLILTGRQELVAPLVERLSRGKVIRGGSARADLTAREQDVLTLPRRGPRRHDHRET